MRYDSCDGHMNESCHRSDGQMKEACLIASLMRYDFIHAMRHDSFMCPSLFSMPFRYATLCVYAMPPYVTHP